MTAVTLRAGEKALLWQIGALATARLIDNPVSWIDHRSHGSSSGGDYWFNYRWDRTAVVGEWSGHADLASPIIYGPGYDDRDLCGGHDCLRVYSDRRRSPCSPGRHFRQHGPKIVLATERLTYTRLKQWVAQLDPARRQGVRDAPDWQAQWWAVRAILGPPDRMHHYRNHYGLTSAPMAGDQYALFG